MNRIEIIKLMEEKERERDFHYHVVPHNTNFKPLTPNYDYYRRSFGKKFSTAITGSIFKFGSHIFAAHYKLKIIGKENLKLINIKENLISSLDNVIKKIDNSSYSEIAFQSLRTDLVKVFQIVLDGNNANNNNDSEEEDGYEDRRRNGNANEVKRYQMAVNNNNMIKNIKITSIAHNKK